MSSPVVDSYLDELLAELPAAAPGEQAAMAQAATAAAMPTRAPEPVAEPTLRRIEPATGPAAASSAPAPLEPRPAPSGSPARPAPRAAVAAPTAGAALPGRTPLPTDPPETIQWQAAPPTRRWLRVALGRDHYAFELLRVQEVVRMAPIVAMRGADQAVLGVMNLRGRIVPVFDLGRWLGGTGVQVGERARIVVVERDDELIGVLVADVEDVASLGREQIEPPLTGSDAGAIVGIARVGNVPTVLLDANALFE